MQFVLEKERKKENLMRGKWTSELKSRGTTEREITGTYQMDGGRERMIVNRMQCWDGPEHDKS